MSLARRCLLRSGLALALGATWARAQQTAAPASPFVRGATAEDVTAGLDLAGRTILVTGASSGLGYETMRVLALRGARVLGTARTAAKGREACASVEGDARPLVLELTDFDSIVDCAAEVAAMGGTLDALICNAGVLLPERERVRGIEKQFVVNHLGHFILVNRLLDSLLMAPEGRVVVVSSVAHWSAPPEGIDFGNLGARGEYDAGRAYGQSKLANGLFALELARRMEGTNVTANALHPGVVETNLFRYSAARVSGGGGRRSVEQGASTICYLASHPLLAGVTGHYFEDLNPAIPSPQMQDAALAARLWDVSRELAADYLA